MFSLFLVLEDHIFLLLHKQQENEKCVCSVLKHITLLNQGLFNSEADCT